MADEKRPTVGVAVIVVRDGCVLLGKRKNAHGAGTWQFPGGHLEYGESIEGCARRELYEETGLSIDACRLGPYTNDIFHEEEKHYITLFVIADQTTGDATVKEPHKCECWAWFKWSEMPTPPFLPIVNLLKQNFAVDAPPSPTAPIKEALQAMANPTRAQKSRRFFKTGRGEYAEDDQFLGIRVPELRKLAKTHRSASMDVIDELLQSPFHEHRQLALFVLTEQFSRSDPAKQKQIVDFYLKNTQQVNNWDLVDASAHVILGAFLLNRDKTVLYQLVSSTSLWDRRIAIVSTWHFIRNGQLDDTFKLATLLMEDEQDLIHKSVGWMLREAGKKDEAALVDFLRKHYQRMPRTMLRYAIERFPETRRQAFLQGKY
ncbi:DNA alkylation repair enzyme [Desulfosarcina variabilis str. Montpellier]|uniref:DNA alkylation repair protein n=1 Tax=Desulfosarcina variabilis TaxID=2300 RepID=UPI003AFA4999